MTGTTRPSELKDNPQPAGEVTGSNLPPIPLPIYHHGLALRPACFEGRKRWYVMGPDNLLPVGKLVTVTLNPYNRKDFPPSRDVTVLVTKHVAEHTRHHRDGSTTRYVLAAFHEETRKHGRR